MTASQLDSFERAYNKRLIKDFQTQLNRQAVQLDPDALKKRLTTFMEENCICHLATCSEQIPRSTVLRYRSRDLSVYIFTEGGGKIHNIRANSNVCITICGEYSGFESCTSLQAWGKAEIISPRQRETYSEIKEFFNLGERPDIKQTGITDIPDMFVIKIELKQLRFLCFPEGILNQELILP